MVLKCDDFVGLALEDVLQGTLAENRAYSIYQVPQSSFGENSWIVLPAAEASVQRKLEAFPPVARFVEVRQGIVTGADDIFIVDDSVVPSSDRHVFVPLLPDRAMQRYRVPPRTGRSVFYPFMGKRKLTEEALRDDFRSTWDYLDSHRARLSSRQAVLRGDIGWWEPERPRSPQTVLRPKIVTPHLILLPRFGLDLTGKYAVTRSPYIYPKIDEAESEILRFLVAVLNSSLCHWYISSHSHRYGSGYTMIEVKTLKLVPISDPTYAPSETRRLIQLADLLLDKSSGHDEIIEIENIVSKLYGVTASERRALGFDP